jgi:predicted DCC family thiol-disulfide oxidoreductase YuxK
VLYDGVCHLCNGTVRFIVARDPSARVAFAPLQSDLARRLLAEHGLPAPAEGDPASVVLVEDGRAWTRSTAVLRIARHLGALWPALSVFLLVPRVLRDGVYDWVARHRYRWFGRSASCEMPGPEVRGRLLDDGGGTGDAGLV